MFATYVGDATLQSELQSGAAKLFYSVTRNSAKKQIYLKLVNAESVPQSVDLKFAGSSLARRGKLVMLKAAGTEATNTIDQQGNIVPVESTLSGIGGELHYTAPQYSIQVLVFDEQSTSAR